MTTCMYDNESTYRRELWRNGELAELATREMIDNCTDEIRRLYPIAFNPWVSGNIVGDPDAMKTTIQKVAHRGDK